MLRFHQSACQFSTHGVVGYHVCLTRTRSPVRSWVSAFLPLLHAFPSGFCATLTLMCHGCASRQHHGPTAPILAGDYRGGAWWGGICLCVVIHGRGCASHQCAQSAAGQRPVVCSKLKGLSMHTSTQHATHMAAVASPRFQRTRTGGRIGPV